MAADLQELKRKACELTERARGAVDSEEQTRLFEEAKAQVQAATTKAKEFEARLASETISDKRVESARTALSNMEDHLAEMEWQFSSLSSSKRGIRERLTLIEKHQNSLDRARVLQSEIKVHWGQLQYFEDSDRDFTVLRQRATAINLPPKEDVSQDVGLAKESLRLVENMETARKLALRNAKVSINFVKLFLEKANRYMSESESLAKQAEEATKQAHNCTNLQLGASGGDSREGKTDGEDKEEAEESRFSSLGGKIEPGGQEAKEDGTQVEGIGTSISEIPPMVGQPIEITQEDEHGGFTFLGGETRPGGDQKDQEEEGGFSFIGEGETRPGGDSGEEGIQSEDEDDGFSFADKGETRTEDRPLSIRPARIQRSGPSAYHIFAAASRLGWAGGLSRYSLGPADQTIIEHLTTAGGHARAAYETSFEPTRAWPNWRSIRSQFNSWAGQLARTRSDMYRRQLANTLAGRYGSLADQLGYQTVKDKRRAANCDFYYCKLGYLMAYGQQALRIAEEAASYGNTSLRNKARRDGIAHLSQAVNVLNNMERVKLASGFCVDLRDVSQWLLSIIRGGSLGKQVQTATKAWKTTLERIMNQQPPPKTAQRLPPDSPPPPLEDKIKPEVRELDKDPGELAGVWYEFRKYPKGYGRCHDTMPVKDRTENSDIQFSKINGRYVGKKVGRRLSLKDESWNYFSNEIVVPITPGTVIYKLKLTGPTVYEGECLVAAPDGREWRETKIIVKGKSAEEKYSTGRHALINDKYPCRLTLKRYKGKGGRRKTGPVVKPQRKKDKIELLGK